MTWRKELKVLHLFCELFQHLLRIIYPSFHLNISSPSVHDHQVFKYTVVHGLDAFYFTLMLSITFCQVVMSSLRTIRKSEQIFIIGGIDLTEQ